MLERDLALECSAWVCYFAGLGNQFKVFGMLSHSYQAWVHNGHCNNR
jgi:hypothetical protein